MNKVNPHNTVLQKSINNDLNHYSFIVLHHMANGIWRWKIRSYNRGFAYFANEDDLSGSRVIGQILNSEL